MLRTPTLLATAVVAGLLILALATWFPVGATASGTESPKELRPGKVELRSIGALEFGPDGVLFVGDPEASAVYALDVGAGKDKAAGKLEVLENLDEKIAAMLGVGSRDVTIEDMAVHRPTGLIYLAITRGRGEGAAPVLLRVHPGGEIAEVALQNIPHARLELANPPAADAKLYRRPSRSLTITDMEYIDGELYIAGLSNEEFASTLRRAPYPFRDRVAAAGLEIYHGAHGEYETFAPIFTFMPYELDGKPHLLAAYLCTPLVSFPLEEVRSKERLRGKTLAELGYGNTPIDMVAYEHDGEEYVLLTNDRRGTMKFRAKDIRAAHKGAGLTAQADPRTGVDYLSSPTGTVVQLDDLDAENVALLGRSPDDGELYLRAYPKQWL